MGVSRNRFSHRPSGATLVEFMVGLTVGLLVVLAAVSSIALIHTSARTLNDSTALEQQATLIIAQIGQQIKQTNAVNAYNSIVNDPNASISKNSTFNLMSSNAAIPIFFDSRPVGICIDNSGAVVPASKGTYNTCPHQLVLFGIDGDPTASSKSSKKSDQLYISYAVPNDGSPVGNCTGSTASPTTTVVPADTPSSVINIIHTYGPAPQIINWFFVQPSTDKDGTLIGDLMCGDGSNSPQPIASNVTNMKITYWSTDAATGNITSYQRAAQVNSGGFNKWNHITGLEICLSLQGDPVQAPHPATGAKDCWGNIFPNDGRIHSTVRQMFYLRNNI
jgi:type IV pilus assembly protein PilW